MGLLSLMRSAGTSGETLTEAEHNAAMHQVGGADDLSAYYARLGAANTFTGTQTFSGVLAVDDIRDSGGSITFKPSGVSSLYLDSTQVIVRPANTILVTLAATTATVADGANVVVGSTTGTKIGTATTQKLGFYNAAPVAQPAAVADVSGGATIDAEARTALNTLLARLRTLGLLAA